MKLSCDPFENAKGDGLPKGGDLKGAGDVTRVSQDTANEASEEGRGGWSHTAPRVECKRLKLPALASTQGGVFEKLIALAVA